MCKDRCWQEMRKNIFVSKRTEEFRTDEYRTDEGGIHYYLTSYYKPEKRNPELSGKLHFIIRHPLFLCSIRLAD
jgi:hypothetical protein